MSDKDQTSQITLPYKELGPLPKNRDDERAIAKTMGATIGRQTYRMHIDNVIVREEFNWRFPPEGMSNEDWLEKIQLIPELALSILDTNGIDTPLEGDMTADGKFILTDGWRRRLAILHLLAEGHTHYKDGGEISRVEVFVNARDTTELDRMTRIFVSQNNHKLSGMEIARGLLRIKNTYGFTNEEIGKKVGMSRQWVDLKIGLAEQPKKIQDAITSGTISETAASAMIRNVKSETEMVHKVEEAMATNSKIKVADNLLKRQEKENKEGMLFGTEIDVTTEKIQAEMDLNEAIGNTDKIRTRLQHLPAQHKGDIDKLLDFVVEKMTSAREFIKKSPNTH